MNAESQGSVAETDIAAKAKALLGEKWFWPILEDLEQFESATDHLAPEANDAIANDAPNWMFRAVWQCGHDMASYTGIEEPQKINARRVGITIPISPQLNLQAFLGQVPGHIPDS